MPTCDPTKSIISFPASLDSRIEVSQVMYDSIEEPLTAEFSLGTRYIAPAFEREGKGIIDEVGRGGLSVNTVRYNNLIYSLYSVGLYSPSHNSWLLPGKKNKNTVDLILIFDNPNQLIKTKYDYVFLVVPILEVSSSDAPSYLRGIASPSGMPEGGYSLKDCMPGVSSQFVYYATCLNSEPLASTSSSGSAPASTPAPTISNISKNAIVFLSVEGINVSSSLISSIKGAPGLGGNFIKISETPLNPQFNVSNFLKKPGSILSSTDVTRYVLSTRVLLDTVRTKNMDWVKGASNLRTDSQASYKCTQFDPEKNTNPDGTVTIDLTSGELLDDVLRERNIVIKSMNTLGDESTGNVKLVPYFIGGILGLLFLFSVGMVTYKWYVTPPLNIVSPIGTPESTYSRSAQEFISKNSTSIIVGIFSIILGSIFGALIALNGAITSKAATREAVTSAVAVARANATS